MYKIRIADVMLVLAIFLGWQAQTVWTAFAAALLVLICLGLRFGMYFIKKGRQDGNTR